MPFKSEAQRRLFYAKEHRGELPKGTSAKWEAHTPEGKLPEHVKHASLTDFYMLKYSVLATNPRGGALTMSRLKPTPKQSEMKRVQAAKASGIPVLTVKEKPNVSSVGNTPRSKNL